MSDELEIKVWPPIFRAIGPGDDMVVSAEKLEAYISKRERQARIDELNKIDEAQQDDDKWGQFSMSDSSDFSNYITQRKSKLNIGDK